MEYVTKGSNEATKLQKLGQKQTWVLLYEGAKMSAIGAARVLGRWQYALIALTAILIFGMVFGVLSVGTSEWNLLVSGLPLADKFAVLTRGITRVFTQIESLSDLLLPIVVTLQGITIALLAYTVNQQRRYSRLQGNMSGRTGESTAASLLAAIGLGCSACGTSLIAPVFGLISSSTIFLGVATTLIMIAAIALLIYSIRKMGHTAYMFMSINN